MTLEIPKANDLEEKVFSITNDNEFEKIAFEVFKFQYQNNFLYQEYCRLLHVDPKNITSIKEIPFLPISFFKSHSVTTSDFKAQAIFESSGTTGTNSSRHFVKNLKLYEKSFLTCFENFFGLVSRLCILGLLPSYLEKENSSLVYMVDALIRRSSNPLSGFYLNNYEQLFATVNKLEMQNQKAVLFGVTYALLDFAELYPISLKSTIVVETGGMKGRKEELSKPELYRRLKKAFDVDTINAEYGMTELLSQAYAADGEYKCPPWMKVLLRDETDPINVGQSVGCINVIDLANIYSCSFIATDDLGRKGADGTFEILGRVDNSDVRGCSQLVV